MTRGEILDKAKEIVSSDRQSQYGTPEDSFNKIGKLWSAYTGFDFNPVDVSVMLALLKVARIANSPQHADNWLDLAGYAACGGEIATDL